MQENKSLQQTYILNSGGTNGFAKSGAVVSLIFPPELNI